MVNKSSRIKGLMYDIDYSLDDDDFSGKLCSYDTMFLSTKDVDNVMCGKLITLPVGDESLECIYNEVKDFSDSLSELVTLLYVNSEELKVYLSSGMNILYLDKVVIGEHRISTKRCLDNFIHLITIDYLPHSWSPLYSMLIFDGRLFDVNLTDFGFLGLFEGYEYFYRSNISSP